MNKKAIFFTILVISILSLFLISYTFYSVVKNRESVQKRISTLNNFVFSMEKDLSRQLYISSFRIIFIFERRITETGNYITNLDPAFKELFFNATLYGTANDDIKSIMGGVNFSGINKKLQENAASINANAELTDPSLTISQEDPWHIKVTLTANLSIKDKNNLASWNKLATITTYIPIENFEDPVYIVGTKGLVTNKINRTIYRPFADGEGYANSNFSKHLNANNSLYVNSTLAPSFLNRLKGDMNADANGIESLVYLPKLAAQLAAQGIEIKKRTIVDYIYFSSSTPSGCTSHVINMADWVRLDDTHLSALVYEIQYTDGMVCYP